MSEHAKHPVMQSIRRALGVTGQEQPRNMTVHDRLKHHPRGPLITSRQHKGKAQIDFFIAKAEESAANVTRLKAKDIPAWLAKTLHERGKEPALKTGKNPRLANLPWKAAGLNITQGASQGQDDVTLSTAMCAIAETGTLLLTSGPDNPSTLNFLPDWHIVIVNESDIVSDYEAAWERLRAEDTWPRTINWITGPSRSADIEQTLLMGAHGPRTLDILLIAKS